jgi:hypothetical protein
VRALLSCLCVFLIVPGILNPQAGGHAKPPGIVAADTASNQPLEPPTKPVARQINLEQLNAETQELRRLADGLPPQIDQVTKGELPKDLAENLKRIEKLAKHLRSEISP